MTTPYTIGGLNCQAAVFCYKRDNTVVQLTRDLSTMAGKPPSIRGEIHGYKAEFLHSLEQWNQQCDPADAFLCIYAHAGVPGIAPIGSELGLSTDVLISWGELADAMPKGVGYLWLLGCKTQQALHDWRAHRSPVLNRLLVTDAKEPWRPFVKWFAAEISLDPIVYNDEMVRLLERKALELAARTRYFGPDLSPVSARLR